MYDYDVISIGAGSGGCASAMRAADLGLHVALVESREKGTGGTCINRGCIPTKVLVKSAEVFREASEAAQYGVRISGVELDMNTIQKKRNSVVNNIRFGLDNFLIKSRNIDRLNGTARFIDAHTLEITGKDGTTQVTAEKMIVATGSEPAMIPAFHIDREKIITSDEALTLQDLPQELIVVGAGALGLEFAYIFSSFGVKVTVVEMMPQVVPIMKEPAITDEVQASLKKQGIEVCCGSAIKEIVTTDTGSVECNLSDGRTFNADMALVAIGRKLNTDQLNLQAAGVRMSEKGLIEVDDQMRTSTTNIYAVGDIVKGPQLSHKAQREGIVAAEAASGLDSRMRYDVIPWAIFMQPEIASVGMTAHDAEEKGIRTTTGVMHFRANEKAMTMQKTVGLIKIVAREEDHSVIGGQIFGPDASVLIAEIAGAIENNMTLESMATSIHAHPTLSEIVMETAKGALGIAFHK